MKFLNGKCILRNDTREEQIRNTWYKSIKWKSYWKILFIRRYLFMESNEKSSIVKCYEYFYSLSALWIRHTAFRLYTLNFNLYRYRSSITVTTSHCGSWHYRFEINFAEYIAMSTDIKTQTRTACTYHTHAIYLLDTPTLSHSMFRWHNGSSYYVQWCTYTLYSTKWTNLRFSIPMFIFISPIPR